MHLMCQIIKNHPNGVDITGKVSRVLDELVSRVRKTTDLVPGGWLNHLGR
ncbi:MAG: hypothetical protein HQ515_11725 [Phycisphaeraceae bacterium]|nr:hypothetical protein [Phycisphaeraceae bacterium]